MLIKISCTEKKIPITFTNFDCKKLHCKYPNTFKPFFNTCKVVLAAANEALVIGRARALIVARQRRARVLRAFRHALASHYQRLKFGLKT
jgi:hypothetical protein